MNNASVDASVILDKALEMAEISGWEALRLQDLAAALDIGLDDIRGCYREKEDLAEAWFDRADSRMLTMAARIDLLALPRRERLERILMAWLEALGPHQRVTRQMILNKLEPGHLHIQIPALMRISRTVQWMREAAGCNAIFARRAFEEVALTGIYLATFCTWLRDDSPDFIHTRHRLQRLLAGTEALAQFRCGEAPEMAPRAAEATAVQEQPSAG